MITSIVYVLSFFFFGYDFDNNNNYNHHHLKNSHHTNKHLHISMTHKLTPPIKTAKNMLIFATLITRNSTPQHAPSSRTRTTSVSVGVPEHPVKVKPPLTIVGDVNGRIAIMVVSITALDFH